MRSRKNTGVWGLLGRNLRAWRAGGAAAVLALILTLAPSALGAEITVSLGQARPLTEGLAQVEVSLRTAEALPPSAPGSTRLFVAFITSSQTCAPTPERQAIRPIPPAVALFPPGFPGWVTEGGRRGSGDPLDPGPIDVTYTASIGAGTWHVCAWVMNDSDIPVASDARTVFGVTLRSREIITLSSGETLPNATTLSNRWDLGEHLENLDSLVARPRWIPVSAVMAISRIRWANWAGPSARGSGIFLFRSYTRGYGHTIPLRSRVIATKRVQCGVGLRVYTRLVVTIAGKIPKGAGPSRNWIWDSPKTRAQCAQLNR